MEPKQADLQKNRNCNSPVVEDVYLGWHELYEAGSEGIATWSEDPPPFMKKLQPFLMPGASILETCCGDGRITETLLSWGISVAALDLSPAALRILSRNMKRRSLRSPLTVIGSATDIPLGDAQFDAVICINGFCQLDRPLAAMQEAARLLRPGGRFMLDIFTPKDGTFGKGEQIAAQDFLYKGTLFRFFHAEQFAGIYKDIFQVEEMFESEWLDPPHGTFRPEAHSHHAIVYILKKIGGTE